LISNFDVRQREAQTLDDAQRAALREQAQTALAAGPFTVTAKPKVPPGGSKHDYWSMGPYWWPNPDTADGLPYVRKDGQVNPETEDGRFDRIRLNDLNKTVAELTHSWLVFQEAKLAHRIVLLLQTFFLDANTLMNPSLTYGQSVPGRCDGRGIGLIETTRFIHLIDHLLLLETQDVIPPALSRGLRQWFDDFLNWMLTSEHGRDERNQPNNHGTWMAAQLAAFALFTGKDDLARAILLEVPARLIDKQIEPDGSQPHELRRTRSLDYSLYNLEGLLTLARLGEHVDVELWGYSSADGRSIQGAMDFLRAFADPSKPWPYEQIDSHSGASNPGLGRDVSVRLDRVLARGRGR
jgi:hypothetical protein